ncbi:Ger(x)C family spore germination protein [Syntrophomonas palmitatica]|uniref:Ger(x)C family spore germination protein n=1 Tax=Syntrophomonas palmitatica TaxID=402877 RepID=UPI0006CFDD65|nr:Ger(x)C family spore germination protein [Syntrophomonas palmitatica]
MKNRRRLATLFLGLVLLMSGCWDARDVDKLAFPLCAGYDVHRGDKQGPDWVDVTTLIPNLSPEAPNKLHVQTLSERTTAYARNPRTYYDADEYLPGINRVLILGYDLARHGYTNYIDTLGRVPGISGTMLFAVAQGRAEEIIKTPAKDYQNNGFYLIILLGEAQKKSFIPTVRGFEMFVNLAPGKNPVLPVVKKDKNKIIIGGAALFRKDKLIYLCNTDETRTMMMLRGIKAKGYYPFQLQGDGKGEQKGTVFIGNRRKVKVVRQGNQYTYYINIKLHGVVVEHLNHAQTLDQECVDCIERSIANKVEGECQRFLAKMQNELKTDCIDINKYALAKWRRELTPVIDSEEFIQNARIEVKAEVALENAGESL